MYKIYLAICGGDSQQNENHLLCYLWRENKQFAEAERRPQLYWKRCSLGNVEWINMTV